MNYYELTFVVTGAEEYQEDLLIDSLAGIGFDTFEDTETGFKAYIQAEAFDKGDVDTTLDDYRDMVDFSYEVNLIPQKNWNEVWESNFTPIKIRDKVYVRATFHLEEPEFPYEIVIDPKMAFGTGHHETTSMIMDLMLDDDFAGKNVLDMGCGTAILAILASKLGAKQLTAIDYDEICYESTLENAALNNIKNITALHGSKEVIPDDQYDIILANINRNILLDQISRYAEVLKPGGKIYFSGFYENPDLEMIKEEAGKYGMHYQSHKKDRDWVAAIFLKSDSAD